MLQILLVAAAAIFTALGTLHGLLTLRDLIRPRAFTPPDPALREAMQRSAVRLHPSINLWDAWMGFNLSHSLGVILFGGLFLHVGLIEPDLFRTSGLLQSIAILGSAIYLLLSIRFWFSRPAIGSGVALACFLAAAGLADLTVPGS